MNDNRSGNDGVYGCALSLAIVGAGILFICIVAQIFF